jgi:glycosyltransferase involved in cell wall biosynthesis
MEKKSVGVKSCAIISSQAFSLYNFRGPLISEMTSRGVKVYALAPDYDEASRKEIISLGAIPVEYGLVRTGMNPLRDSLDMLRLAYKLHRLQPDVSLGYFVKPVIFGTVAAWLAGVPRRLAMIEGLGYVFSFSVKNKSIRRKFLRWLVSNLYKLSLSRAEKVIFLNDDDVSEFVSNGLVKHSKVIKLGGIGVDLMDWPLTISIKKPVTFLLAARLLLEKGIVEFAESARLIKMHLPEVRFVILGGLDPNPGGLRRDQIQTWVSEGLLEWPGHVAVKSWLAQCSVFVLPSYYREGVPRSTQEAMAMGRAVITTDAPGCRETVDDGVNGFLIPVRDVPSLVNAMLRFVENPELIDKMGRESRRIAESRFDMKAINNRLLNILGVF